MAAIPWVEIVLVIPLAIASGLNPYWVTLIAFIGNALPILIIIAAYEKWESWRAERKRRKELAEQESVDLQPAELQSTELQSTELQSTELQSTELQSTEAQDASEEQPSKRGKRGRKIWNKYGLPGFALLAPAVTGIHLAAVMALAFKSPKRPTAIWMTTSLALWSVTMGVVSYYGLGWLDWIR
ncbi:hypothetical protein BHF68_14705 [Desulfuribacillus alkaliarsenatis]|uniref:Small multi-drug export protein n=2 Tax=Desulfuribacillus alkaliarsenatis TaxID=766136 RepID=A0A1E5G3Q3_9FIRM|nr:hypothetical protein BHF68_14705 [Desulfuribacillus alkaliarsenatis]